MFSQPNYEPCQTAKAGTENVGGEAAAATSDSCPHQNTSAAQLLSGVGISFKPPFYETQADDSLEDKSQNLRKPSPDLPMIEKG